MEKRKWIREALRRQNLQKLGLREQEKYRRSHV